MKDKQVSYASPGADDTHLRPKTGNRYSPRQIAISIENESVWMSWIHYWKNSDYLIVTKKSVQNNGDLIRLDSIADGRFSRPTFLRKPDTPPDIFCSVNVESKLCTLFRYALTWQNNNAFWAMSPYVLPPGLGILIYTKPPNIKFIGGFFSPIDNFFC